MLSELIAADVESLVPDAYARFRPMVAAAFRFFVERLAPARRRTLSEMLRVLPADATAACRIVAVMRACPTLHKLGQVIARDRRLDAHLRDRLATLESLPPTTSIEVIRRVLHHELGALAPLGVTLGTTPLAEASVAVVMPFRVAATDASRGPQDGVFKILRPGIVDALHEELAIWSEVGERLDDLSRAAGLPELDYAETFESVRDLLRHEVQLDGEQANLRSAARAYAAQSEVHIPALLPFCTPRVTAMERIFGTPLLAAGSGDAAGEPTDRVPESAQVRSHAAKSHIAGTVVRAILAVPFWSPDAEALFHADPHAGNLVADRRGGVAMLDWALVGRLSRSDRESLTRILVGAAMHDVAYVASSIAALAPGSQAEQALTDVCAAALRSIRRGAPLGLTWLVELLDEAVRDAGVRFGPDLLLFRKVLLTVEGVVGQIDPGLNIDGVLSAAACAGAAAGWPGSLWGFPFDRSFGVHLSAADVGLMLAQTPLAAFRFWTGWVMDAARSSDRAG